VLGDIAQLTNKTAISASQKASAAPIATVLAARGPVFLSAPIASAPGAMRSGGPNMANSRIHSAGMDMSRIALDLNADDLLSDKDSAKTGMANRRHYAGLVSFKDMTIRVARADGNRCHSLINLAD
jgi:hypothetical protein